MTKSERKLAKALAACGIDPGPEEEEPQERPAPRKDKKPRTFSYKITEHIAVLMQGKAISKEVNVVQYADGKPRLDIRCWKRKDGEEQLLKGVTFTDEEALLLEEAVHKYNQRTKRQG